MTAETPEKVKDVAPTGLMPFTIASRPQSRFVATKTVVNLAAADFDPIIVPASGYVRRLRLYFTQAITWASGGAVVAGDGPWNLISNISLTDSTGRPILQPISGYNLYLVNKYFTSGMFGNGPRPWGNPHYGPEFAFSVSGGTTAVCTFRLDIDLEQDSNSGYGSIPNVDSNASLQLRISANATTVAFTGTTPSAHLMTVRVEQDYWAPVDKTINGIPAQTAPIGAGDYVETRLETQPTSAATENIVTVVNRGGLIRGAILISRAAGVRTAITAASPVAVLLDNYPIMDAITIESHYAMLRDMNGFIGTDLTTSYAPATAGVSVGLDRGVLVHNFGGLSGGRTGWMSTRPGSQVQYKLTPGASATSLEIISFLAQIKSLENFYQPSALA